MEQDVTFRAPWGTLLKITTSLLILTLAGIAIAGALTGPRGNILWVLGMVVVPLLILVVASLFIIRGYVLTGDSLLVRRVGWTSKMDLSGLTSVEVDPQAMTKSIRTFGNGGLFCFAGAFYNKKLGSYRAFVMDPRRSVILRWANRVAVVTPEHPQQFAAMITKSRHLRESKA
jgi:hypothetical protein